LKVFAKAVNAKGEIQETVFHAFRPAIGKGGKRDRGKETLKQRGERREKLLLFNRHARI